MQSPLDLNLEQQFSLQMFRCEIAGASREKLEETAIEVLRQLMIKDNYVRMVIGKKILDDKLG